MKYRKYGFSAYLGQAFFALLLFFSLQASNAQDMEWQTKMTKDGLVTIKYRVYYQIEEGSEKSQVIEYEANTIAKASLDACVSIMSQEACHKAIMEGTEEARRIKDLPGGEWVTYYYYKPPWPMPPADIITRYKVEEDKSKKQAILTGTPAPDMYPLQDVDRMEHNHTKYTFTDLGDGKVEIVMYSWSIPLISAPKWLVKTWFPDGPADMVRGIARMAEKEGK
jgi:hypothetical protein